MRRVVAVAGLAVGLGLAAFAWHRLERPADAAANAPPPAAIPVEAATATRADVPVYLAGIGTVQAFNTVTVKVRVDGELQKVGFTEGQMVKPGDFLAQIDPRPFQAQLDQAVAKEAQDAAQLANAKLDLQRFSDLATRQFASRQSVDTQRALVAQDEALVKQDQALIENARVQLGYTQIVSPIGGRTGIRLVDQGNIVHATDPGGLVVVTQLQPISVIFTLPEDDLGAVNDAMRAGAVETGALSRDGKTLLDRGTLQLVDNQIDQTTGTIRLKATFANVENRLWPGEFVNVRLLLRTERGVVTVPSTAIERGADGVYAYAIKPDGTVEMRTLTVGEIDDGVAIVSAGLAVGDRVVTAGQYRLEPGAHVSAAAGKPAPADKVAEAQP